MLASGDRWNRLREVVAEIWILCAAAITGIPGGVHRKLHKICESSDLLCTSRLAAGENAKVVEVDGICAFRGEVGVNELFVRQLILGIVVNVLVHVPVENLDSLGISRISSASGHFFILNPR